MANIGQPFDATTVEPNTGPPPAMPTDWYNVMITESEMKQTKQGDGGYLEIVLKVLDGPHAGRLAWDRLNLYNPNPVAVEIAQKTLSAICHAVNVFQVQDSVVLHGIPMMARIVYKPAEGQYDESNDVKGYAKIGDKESKNAAGTVLTTPGAGAAPSVPAAPAGAPSAPPWGGTPAAPAPAAAAPPAPTTDAPVVEPTFTPPVAAPTPPAAPAPGAAPSAPPWMQ